MAAIDLRAAILPTCYTFTAATTWQEIQLPPSVRVTVGCEATAGYLGFARNGVVASAETPSDGGAVGTHRVALLADSLVSFRLRADAANPSGQSVFMAAQSGTPTYSVTVEHLES